MRVSRLIPLVAALGLSAVAYAEPQAVDPAATNSGHHNNEACPAGDQACAHKGKHGKHHARHHKGGADGMRGMRARMEKLNLSEAQKQEMGTLMGIYQPRINELRKRGQAAREQLLVTAPDAADYSTLVDEVAAEAAQSASEVIVLLADLQKNAYALLTPEQQVMWQQMKTDAQAGMAERQAKWKAKREERKEKGSQQQ